MKSGSRAMVILLVAIEVLTLILGQFMFQKAAHSVGHLSLSLSAESLLLWWHLLILPWFWGALILYVLATMLWVMILQRISLTLAYPLLSSVFVLLPLLAYWQRGVWPSLHFMIGLVLVTSSIAIIGGGIKNRGESRGKN